jgi:hypothetical protein
MLPAQRVYTAIDGGAPDRVPVVPKIWVDLGARLTGTPLTEVASDPLTALRVIARAGRECRVDAVRQFHFPRRRLRERVGEATYSAPAAWCQGAPPGKTCWRCGRPPTPAGSMRTAL